MNKHTKSIAECEKQIGEIERIKADAETELGRIVLTQEDASGLSPAAQADAEAWRAIKAEEAKLSAEAEELKRRISEQKALASESAELTRRIRGEDAALTARFSALAEALMDCPDAEFFAAWRGKIRAAETAARAPAHSGAAERGFFAAIKAAASKSAAQAGAKAERTRLAALRAEAGKAACESGAIPPLIADKRLSAAAESAYAACEALREERDALARRADEAQAQCGADAAFIKNAGQSRLLPAALKIRESGKESGRKAQAALSVLCRAGKRYAESRISGGEGESRLDGAGEAQAAALITRLELLSKDIAVCEASIAAEKRELRIEELTRGIGTAQASLQTLERRLEKLSADKTAAEEHLAALTAELESLQAPS